MSGTLQLSSCSFFPLAFVHCWKILIQQSVLSFCAFVLACVSSINSSWASTKRDAIVAENFNQRQILAITSLLSNFKPIRVK